MPALALTFATVLAADDDSEVYHACYVPGSGTVYRIKEPGLKQQCNSADHVEFSWHE